MSFSNTSLFVSEQVPEFIREEYPLFIQFLKAYYQFLEQDQSTLPVLAGSFVIGTRYTINTLGTTNWQAIGAPAGATVGTSFIATGVGTGTGTATLTNPTSNSLTSSIKDIRNINDVDRSVDQFEDNFVNSFVSLIPKDVQVDKDFLIKNILPLYLSKGIDESFKLLFKLLFNEDVDIILPKSRILRASDGKWIIEKSLKIEKDVRSIHVGNGSNKEILLAQFVNSGEISVYINNTLKQENVDYEIRRESKKIYFTTTPTSSDNIKIVYNKFDYTILKNRKVTGLTSGATALIEKAVETIISENANFPLPFELFIDGKSLAGNFINGEIVKFDVIASDGSLITFNADTFSIVNSIQINNVGFSYNVGDPILVLGGGAEEIATAEVEEVQGTNVASINVSYGGAGFKAQDSLFRGYYNSNVVTIGVITETANTIFTNNTYSVLASGYIGPYAATTINAASYNIVNTRTQNANTRIVDAFNSNIIINLGPIQKGETEWVLTGVEEAEMDVYQAAIYTAGELDNYIEKDLKDLRSIGRIDVSKGISGLTTVGGLNYKVGDEVYFYSNPIGTKGYGAAAAVSNVASNGFVQAVQIQPPRIDGNVAITNNSILIIGTNTNFTNDLRVNDKIVIRCQERYVNSVINTTHATVNVAFRFTDGTTSFSNTKLGSYARGVVGGSNYTQNNFPNVAIYSTTGNGAQIAITSLMGDGDNISTDVTFREGAIKTIKITYPGNNYRFAPTIDLTQKGSGSASATANIGPSFSTFPGRWTTTDSIISSYERRIQGGNYYYDYAYITSSTISFAKYKDILKQLLHPTGFINFAWFNMEKEANAPKSQVFYQSTNTISGLVTTQNNSIYIIGNNTYFSVANNRGILTLGSNVSVNGEIRTINSIISNTNLSVSLAFTKNTSNQSLIILT
jgi:hypothetical protein